MKKILDDMQKVHDLIGFQHYAKDESYKPFLYCVIVDSDGGKLIFNTMTRGMMLMTDDEYYQYMDCRPPDRILESLVKHWYLIPKSIDAGSFCYAFRQMLNDSSNHKLEKLDGYTILTTTNCNARCPYCYEKEYRRRDMDGKTAEDVAEYIRETAGRKVSLRWFGGEPLCNTEAIDIICGKLREANLLYKSYMITNGYLLDRCDISAVKGLWKLRQVQITLDGTQDVYNVTKHFICDDESPFMRVINNINLMLDNEIEVIARLNVSESNVYDMHNLVDFLSQEFAGKRLFSTYLSPLFNEDSEALYDGCISLQKHINNIDIGRMRATPVKKCCCMADSRRSVVITPEGNLGLCEHYADGEHIGSIYNQNLDVPAIESWAERNEDGICHGCLLYPQCIRLKKCPTSSCNEIKQKYQIDQVKVFMLQSYQNHKIKWRKK